MLKQKERMESQATSVKDLLFYIRIIFIHEDFKYFLNLEFYCSWEKILLLAKIQEDKWEFIVFPEHMKKKRKGGLFNSMKFRIFPNCSLIIQVDYKREGGKPVVEVYLLCIISDVEFHTL